MTVRFFPKTFDRTFIERIETLSGERISMCMQCGACSAACPMTEHMDILPRMIMRMLHLGLKGSLEDLKTYWVCASCYACHVVCPRGIEIPKVMEALRLIRLRKNIHFMEPSRIPPETIKDCPQIALVAALRKATN